MPAIDFERPTALYRLFNEAGELLYIGITVNPEVRWASHRCAQSWWNEVARKDLQWLTNRAEALAAEAAAIPVERPRYNRSGLALQTPAARDETVACLGAPQPRVVTAADMRHALRERQTKTVAEGRNALADIINATYYGDGVTVITRRGTEAAAIVPMWALSLLEQVLSVSREAA